MKRSRLAMSFLLLAATSAGCDPASLDSEAPGSADGKADDPTVHALEVQSVWQETSATPGKQFMAILDEDLYSHSEHFLIFGDDEGSQKVRSFVGRFSIIDRAGFSETSQDNFYKLTAEFETDDIVKIKLVGIDGRVHDLVYERMEDADGSLATSAGEAANKLYDRFDALLADELTTLSKFKSYLRLHMRAHDYSPNEEAADGLEWQFVFEWLQIEASVELGDPNAELAGVSIAADGSDAISQHFAQKFGQGWTDDADIPDPEEALDGYDGEGPEPAFYTFENGITGVDPGRIRDGLALFAETTVMALRPFECEGGYDYVRDYYWILSDGSQLSYETMPECD